MVRPCFLVIDREYSGSISTRKLVIETAKFNVITAYRTCCDLVAGIKTQSPKMPVVVISSPGTHECEQADHMLETFEPARLLMLLQSLVPLETAEIEQRNEQLNQIRP
jgi:hypothetical protein